MGNTSKILKNNTVQDFEQKTGLASKFRDDFVKHEGYVDDRRTWAHQTENQFAYLLLSDQFQEKEQELNTKHWEELLLWTYEKDTLEEMAAVMAKK